MASFGQDTQRELPPSQSFFNNPFSIRNILNLSEEPQDRCAQNTSNQRFPIVPQVVRPVEFGRYANVEVGLACYRTTQRVSALRNFPPWLLGTRLMRFLPGKWMKTKRCYLVHVHLRNFYTRRVDVSFQPRLKGFLPLCHLRYLLLRWNLRNWKGRKFHQNYDLWSANKTRLWWKRSWLRVGVGYIHMEMLLQWQARWTGWTVSHLIWADFLKPFLNTSFFPGNEAVLYTMTAEKLPHVQSYY